MTDDRDLDRLLGLLAEEGQDQPDPVEHPGDGKLSFYHAGRLPPEEAEAVREHLVQCQRCRDLLLRHAEFVGEGGDAGEGLEGVGDFGVEVEWRRVRERLGRVVPPSVADEDAAVLRFLKSWKVAYAMAAILCVLVGVSSYRLAQNRVETGARVMSLSSFGQTRSSMDEILKNAQPVEMPKGARSLMLVLGSSSEDYPKYRAVISDRAGRPQETVEFQERVGKDFSLELPRSRLSSGVYVIDVYGVEGEESDLIDRYSIDLRVL